MTSSPSKSEAIIEPLIAASEFNAPSFPTDHVIETFLKKMKNRFRNQKDDEAISGDRLQDKNVELLDRIAPLPAYGLLLDEIDLTLDEFLTADDVDRLQKLILIPAGDTPSVMVEWANSHGFDTLAAPDRRELVEKDVKIPSLAGEGILVIPKLESWFIRHRDGLRHISRLLEAIQTVDRKIIIGCNKWAWAYLKVCVSAHHYLPDPLTFKSFDAERLGSWFAKLSESTRQEDYIFRKADGKDVFNGDADETESYFRRLAGTSRGVPWTAWHLWRGSLRMKPADQSDDKDQTSDMTDQTTLWVSSLEAFSLPGSQSDSSLLMLHAILLHGTLSATDLSLVLPNMDIPATLPLLLGADLIEREQGLYSISAAAYPSVRRGLQTAGFPLDGLA